MLLSHIVKLDFVALLIKGMNFSLTQRRKDANLRVFKVQLGNFVPQFSNADFVNYLTDTFVNITESHKMSKINN